VNRVTDEIGAADLLSDNEAAVISAEARAMRELHGRSNLEIRFNRSQGAVDNIVR
jgi:hypothetical protein